MLRMTTRMLILASVVVGTTSLRAQTPPASGASTSVTVRPARDGVLLEQCSRALSTADGSSQAIQTCRAAVAAADAAGAAAQGPRSARSWLGDVYMFANQWAAALAAYQSALGTEPSRADDPNTGEMKARMAIAQANLGDLAAADQSAESAEIELQSLTASHPAERQHVTALRSTLLFHARIKQQLGQVSAAKALESKAAALGPK